MVRELAAAAEARDLPEGLVTHLASALIDRGATDLAKRLLARCEGPSAWIMLADLEEDAGNIPAALTLVERILGYQFDFPGARERHRRYRSAREPVRAPAPTRPLLVAPSHQIPFDILSEVGCGATSTVFEARDRQLGRTVALKVYHAPERNKTQLSHEARVAVDVEGEGTVRVFDIDPEQGWIAFSWADEGTLRDRIRGSSLSPELLVPPHAWIKRLACALARMHDHGWVHHDIKPANILFSSTAGVILTDFGSARRIGEPAPGGTLGYVSPERITGRPSDPRDDVFSFGCLLESVIDALPQYKAWESIEALARACTGPDAQRPADGHAIVTWLTRVEASCGVETSSTPDARPLWR